MKLKYHQYTHKIEKQRGFLPAVHPLFRFHLLEKNPIILYRYSAIPKHDSNDTNYKRRGFLSNQLLQ